MKLSDLKYQEFEANMLFSLSTYVAFKISSLEKQLNKGKINTLDYLEKRKEYISVIEEFKIKLEEVDK